MTFEPSTEQMGGYALKIRSNMFPSDEFPVLVAKTNPALGIGLSLEHTPVF